MESPLSFGRLDACGANAADVSWTAFLQQHTRTLDGELGELFPQFVMDLRVQIHTSQLERELQSSQVLQILQQKDAEINTLHSQVRQLHGANYSTNDACVQTASLSDQGEPEQKRRRGRDSGENDATMSQQIAQMRTQLDEQQEQIEVLLDELELTRQQLERATSAHNKHVLPVQERESLMDAAALEASPPDTASLSVGISISTQSSADRSDDIVQLLPSIDSCGACVDLSRLDHQLRLLETENHDLQSQRALLSCDGSQDSGGIDEVKHADAVDLVTLDSPADINEPAYSVSWQHLQPCQAVASVDKRDNASEPARVDRKSRVRSYEQAHVSRPLVSANVEPVAWLESVDCAAPNNAVGIEKAHESAGEPGPKPNDSMGEVTDAKIQNLVARKLSRCGAEFENPSCCEESSFLTQHSQSSEVRSAFCSAENLQASQLQHSTMMEEKERHRSTRSQELAECVEKIAALTSANAKLHRKLTRAIQQNERQSAENIELLRKLSRKMKNNVQVDHIGTQTLPAAAPDTSDAETIAATATNKLQAKVEALSAQIASREQENLALLQSLSEIKEENSRAQGTLSSVEAQLKQAKEKYQKQLHEKEIEHVNSLNSYMDQVNERLQRLESDNACLAHDKQQLEIQSQALKDGATKEKAARVHIVTVCDKSIETDVGDSTELAEVARKEQTARMHLLEAQLTRERNRFESTIAALQKSKEDDSQAYNERESRVLQVYERKSHELEELKARLQDEFDDLKASSDEAARESEKRILFLTACVEECSRLVDSPHNEKVTTRDIYDMVVALSRNVVMAVSKKNQVVKRVNMTKGVRATKKEPTRVVLPYPVPRMHLGTLQVSHLRDPGHQEDDTQEHHEFGAQDTFERSSGEAQIWMMRAAKLEQQLRISLLKNSNFEDTIRRLEVQVDDLKAELKERMTKELALTTRNGLLKAEVKSFKTNFATLSSRYNQVCGELQLQMDDHHATDDEMSRIRSAMQRKSELLAQNKVNVVQLKDELHKMTLKADQLAATVKSSALFAHKAKEQMQVFQTLRRQLEASQAQEYQLAKEIETEKDRNANSQARVKSLRAENSELRSKWSDLKKQLTAQGGEEPPIADNEKHATKMPPHNTTTSLLDEVKALRRRVLQKQQLVIGFKSKMSELETEITHLHTKLFDATQTNRVIQADQVSQKEMAMRHVAAMKEEMEAIVSEKVYKLDGLRASIYDSLEVFVHTASTKRGGSNECRRARSPKFSDFSCAVNGSNPAISENQDQLSDKTILNLRRWTDLSIGDLNALHLQQRSEPKPRKPSAKELGNQLLSHVERALEHTPDECRAEICRVLEFLIAKEREMYGSTNEEAPSH